jgi:hypothetical protein
MAKLPPKANWARPNALWPTEEHVFPRHPPARILSVIRRLKALLRYDSNKLASHYSCNSNKSNRVPTGCEIITLMWVQEVLYERGLICEVPAPLHRPPASAGRRRAAAGRIRLSAG